LFVSFEHNRKYDMESDVGGSSERHMQRNKVLFDNGIVYGRKFLGRHR